LVEWLAGETDVPSAALSTTNPTCCPGANQGSRGGKPATNRLSYDTAWVICKSSRHLQWHGDLHANVRISTAGNMHMQTRWKIITKIAGAASLYWIDYCCHCPLWLRAFRRDRWLGRYCGPPPLSAPFVHLPDCSSERWKALYSQRRKRAISWSGMM
jgi:hypothetical protein